VLPLDLHVLGLPPAFTLSQDQTLQLKLQAPGTNPLGQTFEREPSTVKLAALTLLGRFVSMDLHPPQGAHTSYLRTLSKIIDLRGFLRPAP
jgi:hypothetical protein